MRKLAFVLSLMLIAAAAVILGTEIMRLSDLDSFPGFVALASVLFGILGGACFRLFRFRLVERNGRILILGPAEKIEQGKQGSAP